MVPLDASALIPAYAMKSPIRTHSSVNQRPGSPFCPRCCAGRIVGAPRLARAIRVTARERTLTIRRHRQVLPATISSIPSSLSNGVCPDGRPTLNLILVILTNGKDPRAKRSAAPPPLPYQALRRTPATRQSAMDELMSKVQ